MNEKVYTLYENDEYYNVIGVFAKKEDAEAMLAATDPAFYYFVEEVPLHHEPLPLKKYWYIREDDKETVSKEVSGHGFISVARRIFGGKESRAATKEAAEEAVRKL